MTTPAVRDSQSPLEAALVDVHTTLAELLAAADEQYAALVARDHERLESVTRQQERLSARLANAEARRMQILDGTPLPEAISALPTHEHGRVDALRLSISFAVRELKARQARSASLLQRSIEMTSDTLSFLMRLVSTPSPSYGTRGVVAPRSSILVDSRA